MVTRGSCVMSIKPTAGVRLLPPPVRVLKPPRKLHIIKLDSQICSVWHENTCILAFLQYEAARQYRDHLWRSYEATGILPPNELDDRKYLRYHFMQEAKPVNSNGDLHLDIDSVYFQELRDICLRNIISLIIVTSITHDSSQHSTYHCHKYLREGKHGLNVRLLQKKWDTA